MFQAQASCSSGNPCMDPNAYPSTVWIDLFRGNCLQTVVKRTASSWTSGRRKVESKIF